MASFIRCALFCNFGRRFTPSFLTKKNYGQIARLIATQPRHDRDSKGELAVEINKKIDYNFGISSELLRSFYSSLENSESVTEQDVGLLLHVCSTGPFDATLEKRLAFVEEVWGRLKDFGIPPTTRLYNVKLKTFCASKKLFNPLDELMNMKSLGLTPDKITYQLLIEGFCQKGDISGANVVLGTMEELEYLLNVNIFNSFITGHLKAGSLDEASKVLEIMRSKGISPIPETYYRYAAHFAEQGDINSVIKYISEAESTNVPLTQKLLLDVYQIMVQHGHEDKASELLNHITSSGMFSSTTFQKSCHLLSEGHTDAAFELYLKMPRTEEGKMPYHSGSYLIKTMVYNHANAQDLMNMADKIQEASPKSLSHQHALYYAYKNNNIDVAVQLIELMKAKNYKIKATYILPAICHYKKLNNKEGVFKMMKMLMEHATGSDKADYALSFCYPTLTDLGLSRKDILAAFPGNEQFWNTIFFCKDIVTEGFTYALKSVQGKEILALHEALSSSINSVKDQYLSTELQSCVSILQLIYQLPDVSKEKFRRLAGDVLFISLYHKDWKTAEQFLKLLAEKKLRINSSFQTLKFPDLPKNIHDKIVELAQVSKPLKPGNKEDLNKLMDYEPTELVEQAPSYSRKSSHSKILTLFQEAIKNNNLEEMKQRQRELKASGFIMKPTYLNNYIRKLIQLKDIDTATSLFNELKNKGDGMYDKSVPLLLGASAIKSGNVQGALDMLKLAAASKLPSEENLPTFNAIKSMLGNCPSLQDAEVIHKAIIKYKIVPETDLLRVHQAYVSRILMHSDDDDVVKYIMKLHEHYHVLPNVNEVLARFIAKKDVERLKRVMDLGLSIFGNNYFHHLLAFGFLQCGMSNKAAAVLQTPGLKLNEKLILDKCQYYIKQKNFEWLSALVDITKSMPISRSLMLKQLAECYIAANELAKATDVIKQFLDDFLDPPADLLKKLTAAFQSAKKDLPEVLSSLETRHVNPV